MTKKNPYIPFIVVGILLILVFLFGRSCGNNNVITVPFDSKKVKSQIRTEIDNIKRLKSLEAPMSVEVIKWRTKWREGRHDTIPCEDKLPILINICDSIIVADSSLIETKDLIIVNQDSVIKNYQSIVSQDSVTIKGLHKEVKKQKRQKWLVLIGSGLVAGALIVK